MRTRKAGAKRKSKPKPKKLNAIARLPSKVESVSTDWVALELTQRGETEKDVSILVEVVKKTLGDPNAEVFVPIYYEDEEFFEKNVVLLNGYFFIRHDPLLQYAKLKESKYFEGVVCNPLTKAVNLIPDSQVQALRSQFDQMLFEASKIGVGQTVQILDGLYKGLSGRVKKVLKRDQMCIIEITSLKSRKITVSAPMMSIAPVDDGDSGDSPKFL